MNNSKFTGDITELMSHMNNTQLIRYASNIHVSFDSPELIKELCDRLVTLGDVIEGMNRNER
jgi:hypothetical protein